MPEHAWVGWKRVVHTLFFVFMSLLAFVGCFPLTVCVHGENPCIVSLAVAGRRGLVTDCVHGENPCIVCACQIARNRSSCVPHIQSWHLECATDMEWQSANNDKEKHKSIHVELRSCMMRNGIPTTSTPESKIPSIASMEMNEIGIQCNNA